MGRTQSSSSHARPTRGGSNSRGGRGRRSGRGRGGHAASNAHAASSSKPNQKSAAPTHKRKRTVHIKDGIAIRKSIQQLKAELRGAERLHAKKTASGDFATEDSLRKRSEAKIAALKAELATAQGLDKAKVEKFDVIYRSVKFFERIKASRRIEKLRKQIAKALAAAEMGGEGDVDALSNVKELQEELQQAEFDLVYVLHYPAATKYIALWPTSGSKAKESEDEESSSDEDKSADDSVAELPALSEKAIKQRNQVRAHLQALIDLGLINVAETVCACVGEPGEEREKKKTKKKGDTEEDVKHKQIGHLLRGVGVAGLSDDGDEDSRAMARPRATEDDDSSSSDEGDSSDSSDGADDMNMDEDDFFMN